jgi:predicted DNA-binding transcriptional regulator AlpA
MVTDLNQLSSADLLDVKATCKFFGGESRPITRGTLYRGIAEGRYPKPIKVAAKAVRWLAPECRAARAAMIAARDS